MAWISGSLTAAFIPDHEETVKAVLKAAEGAIKKAAEDAGFDSIYVTGSVSNGSGGLSVSLSKSTTGPATCAG